MRFRLFLGFLTLTANPAWAQDCSVELFRASQVAQSDEVTRLSIAWSMSREAYEEAREGANASGSFLDVVDFGGSYEQFRQNIQREAESLNIDNFAQRSSAYASSGLNREGLDAYKTCLLSRGGLQLVTEEIGQSTYTTSLLWNPPLGVGDVSWSLISTENLNQASVDLLEQRLASMGPERQDLQLILTPQDRKREASLVVSFGPGSRALRLPPVERARTTPTPRPTLLDQAFAGGEIFFIIERPGCQPSDYGTLQCNHKYRAQYARSTNTWSVTGHNEGTGGVGTWSYSNLPAEPGILSAWGRGFRFDNAGNLYDLNGQDVIGRVTPE